MKQFKKQLILPKQQYYETHLYIVNSVLPTKLTNKELEVLACFMSLDEGFLKDRFGAAGKSIVKERLSLSAAGLSNYLKILKEKGFIISKDGVNNIHPKVMIESTEQDYYFKIKMEDAK